MFSRSSDDDLNNILQSIPYDIVLRNAASNVAQNIHESKSITSKFDPMMNFVIHSNSKLIESILMIIWLTSTGCWTFNFDHHNLEKSSLHDYFVKNFSKSIENIEIGGIENNDLRSSSDIYEVCNEAIDLMTVLVILTPNEELIFLDDPQWHEFFIDLVLLCEEESIRQNFMEQLSLILLKFIKNNPSIFPKIHDLMFSFLENYIPSFTRNSSQFFQIFCNILKCIFTNKIYVSTDKLLKFECDLLKNPKVCYPMKMVSSNLFCFLIEKFRHRRFGRRMSS